MHTQQRIHTIQQAVYRFEAKLKEKMQETLAHISVNFRSAPSTNSVIISKLTILNNKMIEDKLNLLVSAKHWFDYSDFVRQAFIDGAGIKLPAESRQQGQYVVLREIRSLTGVI
ncbi:hypothetical protein [Paenibacillus sp. 1P07SE]|uniref:hypothetical protein n=1 Tax=Paenibacillus sp. 1P07SE TaxID=3132209 RepID=UPI0039A57279